MTSEDRKFVRQVARLTHSGDDGWTPPDDADDAHHALDGLIAQARDLLVVTGSRTAPPSWRPMEEAPRDGRTLLAWTVHANAQFSKDPAAEGWACVSVIKWIDHNGGGWTWNGLAGEHVGWLPAPAELGGLPS